MSSDYDEESVFCYECGKKEDKPSKVIECAHCHRSAHFHCKGITGNAIPKVRKQPYFCTVDCQEMHNRASLHTSTESPLLTRILAEVQSTREEVHSMKATVQAIESSQKFLAEKFDILTTDVGTLKTNPTKLTRDVEVLQTKQQSVGTKVDQLELELDKINRTAISKNAILIGLPMSKDEDVSELIYQTAAAINCKLPDGAITEAKRLVSNDKKGTSTKTVPIKSTFSDVKLKERLLACKKDHEELLQSAMNRKFGGANSKVILRDEMTQYGMNLLSKARGSQALIEFKFIWPGRHGVVLAKKTENSTVVVIRSFNDLQHLERVNAKRQLNNSDNDSSSDSPTATGLPPKR